MRKLVRVDAKSVNDPGPQNKVKPVQNSKNLLKMKINIIVLENNGLIIDNLYSCDMCLKT